MAGRRIERDRSGGYRLRLPAEERQLLRSLPAQLREVLRTDGRRPADPSLRRLFPPAYADDAEADDEFRRLMRDELLEGKLAALRVVEETADADHLTRRPARSLARRPREPPPLPRDPARRHGGDLRAGARPGRSGRSGARALRLSELAPGAGRGRRSRPAFRRAKRKRRPLRGRAPITARRARARREARGSPAPRRRSRPAGTPPRAAVPARACPRPRARAGSAAPLLDPPSRTSSR